MHASTAANSKLPWAWIRYCAARSLTNATSLSLLGVSRVGRTVSECFSKQCKRGSAPWLLTAHTEATRQLGSVRWGLPPPSASWPRCHARQPERDWGPHHTHWRAAHWTRQHSTVGNKGVHAHAFSMGLSNAPDELSILRNMRHVYENVNGLRLGFSNTTRNPEGKPSHNNRKS
jgi:hypothetical protein